MLLRHKLLIVSVFFTAGLVAGTAQATSIPSPADLNLLPGHPLVSSTTDGAPYDLPNATNGLAGGPGEGYDFVFHDNDSDQRLVVHGFNSPIGLFRLYTGGDLRPNILTLKSSTTDQASLTGASYETSLLTNVPIANSAWIQTDAGDGPSANHSFYVDFVVSAPAGTQSLWADFGNTNGSSTSGFTRIGEIQAFVPEPASVVLSALGAVSLLLVAGRQRRA